MPPSHPQKAPPFLGQVRIFSVLLKGNFYSWFWSRQRGRAEKVGLSVSGAPALYLSPETISTTALTSLGGGEGDFKISGDSKRYKKGTSICYWDGWGSFINICDYLLSVSEHNFLSHFVCLANHSRHFTTAIKKIKSMSYARWQNKHCTKKDVFEK